MARPRKPSDPNQWPIPCGRCGEHHQIVANWPDGGVCGYCYQQAKRTRGTCVCGHKGVLPGRIDGQPACRRCSGVKLNVGCKTCGAEDELYRGSRCWSCELAALVDQLFTNPDTGVVAAELVPVAAALKSMKRSNSGVTWIRQRHVTAFLKDLAVAPSITHEKLDELPELSIARHRRGTSPKLPKSEQDAAVERVVHTDELTARDRAAAILVIVFGGLSSPDDKSNGYVLSMPLAIGFSALAAGRGWQPVGLPCATSAHTAMAAIGAAWHTTLARDPASPLRGPWRFANAMCGGALMAIRMSVPRARRPGRFGRSRPP